MNNGQTAFEKFGFKWNLGHLGPISVILIKLQWFNLHGIFSVEGGHDEHSLDVIGRKVTKQIFRKIVWSKI